MMDNPERFRAVIRVLLRQQLADVSILNELNKVGYIFLFHILWLNLFYRNYQKW